MVRLLNSAAHTLQQEKAALSVQNGELTRSLRVAQQQVRTFETTNAQLMSVRAQRLSAGEVVPRAVVRDLEAELRKVEEAVAEVRAERDVLQARLAAAAEQQEASGRELAALRVREAEVTAELAASLAAWEQERQARASEVAANHIAWEQVTHALTAEVDELTSSRAAGEAERRSLMAEVEELRRTRDAALRERDEYCTKNAALQQEKEALCDFVRTQAVRTQVGNLLRRLHEAPVRAPSTST